MQFHSATKSLYTDDGELIKVLFCPLRKRFDQLESRASGPHPVCSECEREVLDTSKLSEAEVVAAVRTDPATCLCVSSRQANVAVLHRTLTVLPRIPDR